MNQRVKKWAKFALQWTIAIGGMTWVLSNMNLRDRALVILDGSNKPVDVALNYAVTEDSATFPVIHPQTKEVIDVPRDHVVNRPDVKQVMLLTDDGGAMKVNLLGLDLSDLKRPHVDRFLIADPKTGDGVWVDPTKIANYKLQVPRPRDETGILSLVHGAMNQPGFLWAAVLVFPLTYLITSYRWHELLKALEIPIGQLQTFKLNMVASFYNTFMPGSTGGDLLKAYYAAKHTPFRTRAVMSVIIDRVIGLMGLIILGGVMAAYQYFAGGPHDAAAHATGKVALASAGLIVLTIIGLVVFYTPILRKFTGLDFILKRLPMQTQVQKAVETMEILRRRPVLVLWALIVTFPVHMTVVTSAMFAGFAFGLTLHPLYYWVCVPVIVLVGAIPISPQGAGVMEFFAILLTRSQGVSVSGAFALTNSIRFVQILWNLTGGIFALTGGYHPPSDREQESMDSDGPSGTPATLTIPT